MELKELLNFLILLDFGEVPIINSSIFKLTIYRNIKHGSFRDEGNDLQDSSNLEK